MVRWDKCTESECPGKRHHATNINDFKKTHEKTRFTVNHLPRMESLVDQEWLLANGKYPHQLYQQSTKR